MPGLETFDPAKGVLHCGKPGTGSVDAPRAFSLKLQGVLERIGLKPCSVDPELWFLHKGTQLTMGLTQHVDDLKATGETTVIVHVFGELQKVFGELKIIWTVFTNCGFRRETHARWQLLWLKFTTSTPSGALPIHSCPKDQLRTTVKKACTRCTCPFSGQWPTWRTLASTSLCSFVRCSATQPTRSLNM